MTETIPVSAPRPSGRVKIIDTARAVALIAMASYHFSWDLEFFGYLDAGITTHGPLKVYARMIAGSFLFLVGVSLVLAHRPQIRWRGFGKRLAMVVGAALLITVATYFATPDAFIFFGILHAIALFSLLGLAFLRLPFLLTAVIGAGFIALPQFYVAPVFDQPLLYWVGLSDVLPRTNDYVPLFPWFGMVLFGIAATRAALAAGLIERLSRIPAGPKVLQLAGRHSLAFYLVHQPVLIGIAYLLTLAVPPPAPDPDAGYLSNCQMSCTADGNDVPLCTRFCACTLERLHAENLLEGLQSGAISAGDDERIRTLASGCTAASQ
ncbi:DUF1624 domain-containing protein [Rhizobium halophytocola]|uniref:Membrane protein n=1 Tax=Rhizobium halophytocola TaxID=735519 RepID=A0ABS4DZQ2_9HYPH|nr:DUF1624 domain-containing protein [Rhizobium halophytocola]MBP1851166.1 putative membrane protein [Rhizobium halophytocola]